MQDTVLEAEQLTLNYGKTSVLWDINLKIASSQLVGVIGPNGAGKSTFLKAALGIVKPLTGRLLFWGKSINAVRSKVAYVPQKESIDWDFPITAFEVVLMGRYGRLKLFRRILAADKEAAKKALEMLGMLSFANRQISELSGGQQQRLFLARALIQDADIYLMDEPFQGVDACTEKIIMELLRKLRSQGKTIIVVHHDPSTIRKYFDSLILLNTSLVACGAVEKVLTKENLTKTFSKGHALFDEAYQLCSNHFKGLI